MAKLKYLVIPLFLLVSLVFLQSPHAETFGVKKKRPRPNEYGNVVINNFSEKNKIAPVVFKHWLHRSKYTCRLCHVDIGFAMKAGGTMMTEEDNKHGMYCGACHNGVEAFAPQEEKIIGGAPTQNCVKCHSLGEKVNFKYDFYTFKKGFPRERFGNEIDWLKAEEEKLITLKDYIEGISIKRRKLKSPEEFNLSAEEKNMPDIVFSHEKHAIWSGCELCHPDIFAGVKRGAVKYTMLEIFNGKYCGACHGSVAFPNNDCQRCHTKEVY
jgi:c(7)-type cytochrome triheme protein